MAAMAYRGGGVAAARISAGGGWRHALAAIAANVSNRPWQRRIAAY